MFQRVDLKSAGPKALGVLVPHGPRTIVILRPRGLAWDLLPAHWDGDRARAPQFCSFTRDEAAAVAKHVVDALAAAGAVDPLETFGTVDGAVRQLWVRTTEHVWIVCRRVQGAGYQPMTFAAKDEAERAAELLRPYVWPAADVVQEYYFNTQQFA